MNLGKVYSSSELESLLDAKCSINTDLKLDTISTLSHPVNGSLGFINKSGNYDTSKFSALIVDESHSDNHSNKIVLFKSRNVMRSVSLLLKDVSKNQTYKYSEKYPHVTIGENVKIGKNCIITAQVGFAGSTKIGDKVLIGGQAGISGHLNIGNNVKIGGGSGVIKDIPDNSNVMGYPAQNIKNFIKENKKTNVR